MSVKNRALPCRKRMVRASGLVNSSWIAATAVVKAGYRPKTIPLDDDLGSIVATPEIAARLRALWAEMLEYMAGVKRSLSGASIGTLAWIIDLYQTDQDSPYIVFDLRLRPATTARWRSCVRQPTSDGSTRSPRMISADGSRLGKGRRKWRASQPSARPCSKSFPARRAQPVDTRDVGTHTQLATNRRYSRDNMAATAASRRYVLEAKIEPRRGGA
jgi:hypothetical protein